MPNPSKHRRTPVLVSIGSAIRKLRLEKGISQEQLSLISDVDTSYVSRVERGENNVALLTLHKLAVGLGVTLTELMNEANL